LERLEAASGFEPENNGFADRCLTSWLCRLWSGKRDSNPRLQPWQGCTLPLSYSRSPVFFVKIGALVKGEVTVFGFRFPVFSGGAWKSGGFSIGHWGAEKDIKLPLTRTVSPLAAQAGKPRPFVGEGG
jgi:hypothetical protein